MTHAAGLQVGTVVQATLLPTETTGNAAGTAALTTANATQATHVSEGRRTRAAAVSVAVRGATTANTGTNCTVCVGVSLTGIAISGVAIAACTGCAVTSS